MLSSTSVQGLLSGVTMGLGGVVSALFGGFVFDQWGRVTMFSLAGLGRWQG